MKKYVIKATALAIGALVGGAAVASVDFTADPVATTGKLASEFDYSKATGTAITGAAATTKVTTKLGFGVSASQNRYIRVDLGGLKLAAAAASGDVHAVAAAPLTDFGNVTVVAGGSVGDTYVIYQVTGAASGHSSSQVVTVQLPNVNTTAGNGTSPTVTYALYETAVAAANNTAGTSLYATSGKLFSFASGVKITSVPFTNTALVAKSYKEFAASTGVAGLTSTAVADSNAANAEIGRLGVTFDNTVLDASGAALTALSQLYAATSSVVIRGDFTATGGGNGPVVTAGNNCTGAATSLAGTQTLSADKQTFSYTPAALTDLASFAVCWNIDKKVAVPAQTFTYDVQPVAAAATVTVTDPAAATFGSIKRDGTVLQAPFATIHPDYLSRIVLTSQYSLDAAYTLSVITEDGVTCTGGTGATGTLKKGVMAVINVKDICTGTNTGATRLAVQAVIAAPLDTVHGLYNVMNYDQATGKTNSLISYTMVRPTEN